MGESATWNVVNSFFKENMDLSEKNVLFCQFKFVYFLLDEHDGTHEFSC